MWTLITNTFINYPWLLNTATIFEYTHIHIDPPVVNVTPSPQRIPRGNTLTLFCVYESVPSPDVTWSFNSSPLSSVDPRITTTELCSELALGSLEESEGGMYTCSASNIVGGSSRDIEVILQGVQHACVSSSHWSSEHGLLFTGRWCDIFRTTVNTC